METTFRAARQGEKKTKGKILKQPTYFSTANYYLKSREKKLTPRDTDKVQ